MSTVVGFDPFLRKLESLDCPEDLLDRLDWCRKIISLCRSHNIEGVNSLEWLEVLDSETDEYPSGETRLLWSESALKEADSQLLKVFSEDLKKLPDIYKTLVEEAQKAAEREK